MFCEFRGRARGAKFAKFDVSRGVKSGVRYSSGISDETDRVSTVGKEYEHMDRMGKLGLNVAGKVVRTQRPIFLALWSRTYFSATLLLENVMYGNTSGT